MVEGAAAAEADERSEVVLDPRCAVPGALSGMSANGSVLGADLEEDELEKVKEALEPCSLEDPVELGAISIPAGSALWCANEDRERSLERVEMAGETEGAEVLAEDVLVPRCARPGVPRALCGLCRGALVDIEEMDEAAG